MRTTGLRKSFFKNRKEIPVVNGVDLELFENEIVGVIGTSGAGKSTLLHVLGTLEKPTEGSIEYFPNDDDSIEDVGANSSIELTTQSDEKLSEFRNRSLGFVFQFHYLLPEFTALENVMMPALIAGYSWRPAMKQAQALLEFVGLADRMEHRPTELSGGEQQRVAIARAVILRPRMIMADELTGNLDSSNREKVMDLLVQLHEETGVSILLVTHDMALRSRMHRVLTMKDGRLSSEL